MSNWRPFADLAYLREYAPTLSPTEQNALANWLKDQLLTRHSRDAAAALRHVDLLHALAAITQKPTDRALALRMGAFVQMVSYRNYPQALNLFAAAREIYEAERDWLGLAQLTVSHVWGLAAVGRIDEALQRGAWAREILTAQKQWRDLATLLSNLAAIHGQQSDYQRASELLDAAIAAYDQLGEIAIEDALSARCNRASVLRYLGRFDDSITLSRQIITAARERKLDMLLAIFLHTVGDTYFVSGRVHEAIVALDEAREAYSVAGRETDALLVDQELSRGLLYIGRNQEAYERSQHVAHLCTQLNIVQEAAAAQLTTGLAEAALGRHSAALKTLATAEAAFLTTNNQLQATRTTLERAAIFVRLGDLETAKPLTDQCLAASANDPLQHTRALLLAGEIALLTDDLEAARQYAEQAATARQSVLHYKAVHLQGRAAHDPAQQLAYFLRAIDALEQLQGWMLPQFRPNFILDKEQLYSDAVNSALQLDQPEQALTITERAKARALLAMLSHRVTTAVDARSAADQPLLAELNHLREQRDVLFRRWESREFATEATQKMAWAGIESAEKQIADLWQRLLTRNADYARDAALWQVQIADAQPYLAADEALIEYFASDDNLIAFVVTCERITARRLAISPIVVRQKQQQLQLNFAIGQRTGMFAPLRSSAQQILSVLYAGLIAPLIDECATMRQLIIVPHGILHYLPFAALYDGERHLVERFELRQLPASSFLAHYAKREGEQTDSEGDMFVAGYALAGQLEHIRHEVEIVAERWDTIARVASRALLDERVAHCQLLHLAAHAVFRADNPLFSGLQLADGWLTTLDVFGWRLSAELVTLSACDTGRTVVGGGDELLGLMQAFITAGAASLLMTHWAVEDSATATLMANFYAHLRDGLPKARALQLAQIAMLANPQHSHPYFWAAFMLIGADGGIG